jgi:Protein of unknown function (DUF2608)
MIMMNRYKILILICVCIFSNCAALDALIVETPHFSEIKKYVTPKTLVLLDIDDTLLIPAQTLGTDVWFLYRVEQHKANGIPHPMAFEKALAEWESIRHVTKVKIVEAGTEKIVEELQKDSLMVMGLTTQGLALATRTIQHLNSLNIDLSKTAPSSEDHYFINGHGVLYRAGVLFTSGTPKGTALLKLLELVNYYPSHILFINDKATHLKDVEQALQDKNIDFVGLRYSYSDKRVADFNRTIADIQWQFSSFNYLISDDEAEEIMRQSNAQSGIGIEAS